MTINRLLIANRGEIASRIMRTCRAMGIETVAVFSDADAGAAFVREADVAVAIGGTTPTTSYLRIEAIVDAARRAGADGVHPGYGFLAESSSFARAVLGAGLVWVGPPPDAIETMGSKLAARELMTRAGVPVVPGADLSRVDDADLTEVISSIGLPLLVKASAGGGGRGMRIVREAHTFVDAVASARREAASAFGDDTVFVERYIERPRHIEIQVMADAHGNVVHLFERECSIQRRHQKIIEEAPSPRLTDEQRAAMGDAAVIAAQSVGYLGAGTVEFIVAPDGTFSFLEMNTRLQVEHPVTELVTGLDLVRLQIEVADGRSLPEAAMTPTRRGHAIEARLYAEDPDHDYLPSAGTIRRFDIAANPAVRVDAGYQRGDIVSPNYDPLLAKVISFAPTRAEAARVLAQTLRRSRIDGVITNRELLIAILEHEEFLAGETDTSFLERHPPQSLTGGRPHTSEVDLLAIAAAVAQQAAARESAEVLRGLPSGYRNNRSQLVVRRYRHGQRDITVGYAIGRDGVIEVDGARRDDVRVQAASTHVVTLEVNGVRATYSVDDEGSCVDVAGHRGGATLLVHPRFPRPEVVLRAGSLIAPMPGTVVRVDAQPGARVAAGAVLAVIEAMKMEHQITTPVAGVVEEVRVAVGQTVDADAVLVVVGDEEGA